MRAERRAQSALEYLMTYGWAILIIVIVGAALFALGVFNPSENTGMQVKGLSNFHIDDAALTQQGNLTLILGVKTGRTTQVLDINYTAVGLSCQNTADEADISIAPSRTSNVALNPDTVCSLTSGAKVQLEMNISYQVAGSTLTHIDKGYLTLLVQ